jgi:glycosyltransferase involved in cell wall biosynthesis
MSKKISIITPSYNSGQHIEDAINSVLGQEYERFEHIVVDGGSEDNTVEILGKYPHVKWVSEPDNGQSHAMNKGFAMSSGDIIGYLNADDYYLPGAFKSVLHYFEEDADCVVGKVKVLRRQFLDQ